MGINELYISFKSARKNWQSDPKFHQHRYITDQMGDRCMEQHWYDTVKPRQPWHPKPEKKNYLVSEERLKQAPWQMDSNCVYYKGRRVPFGQSVEKFKDVFGERNRNITGSTRFSSVYDSLGMIAVFNYTDSTKTEEYFNHFWFYLLSDFESQNGASKNEPTKTSNAEWNILGKLVNQNTIRDYTLDKIHPDRTWWYHGLVDNPEAGFGVSSLWDYHGNVQIMKISGIIFDATAYFKKCPEYRK